MKNISYGDPIPLFLGIKKIITIMKISFFISLIVVVSAHASAYSQTKKLDLVANQQTVRDILKIIEKHSDFRFFYNEDFSDLNKVISLEIKDGKVDEVLGILFNQTDITYKILENNVVVITPTVAMQQHKITGTVTDASTGEPLPGVSIGIENTNIGITTDFNGNYTIEIPGGGNPVLVVSYIGYNTERVQVNDQKVVDIKLVLDILKLNEVVVVGYGTNKKVNVTGAISTIDSKDINSVSSSNLTDNLTGKLPGLRVLQRTSEPGDYSSTYNIRGWGSPLVIIDGVQRDDFNKLDPNEIESVTVLKDASAAIYGVKAANGVLLITTHKGKEGKPAITLNSHYGIQSITAFPHAMNAAQWVEVTNEAYMNAGNTLPYSEQDLANYRNGTYPSTDWFGLIVKDNTPQQQHSLTISGGSDKIKYFTSLGYTDQDGLWKSGDLNYHRFNLRANMTARINKYLDTELSLGGILDKKNAPYKDTWNVFKAVWMQKPTIPVYANNDPDHMSEVADGLHPIAITNSDISGYNITQSRNFQSSFAVNYKIPYVEGLKARFFYSYDMYYDFTKKWKKQYSLYDYNAANDSYTTYTLNNPSSLAESYSEINKATFQTSLSYEKQFGKHNVKGLVLFENIKSKADNFNGSRDFSVDAVDQMYAGNTDNEQISSSSGSIYELVNEGIVGRLNYDFSSKYLFEYGFRYDGSSKFAKGHRWGFFPSFSVGWRVSEEDFIKNNVLFISNLKVRASWGKLGDDNSSSNQYLAGYTYPSGTYVFDGSAVSGLGSKSVANQEITWYKATTENIGIEGNLWHDMINFQFDVFTRKRSGLLATRSLSLPNTVGASLPQENINSDKSNGFEVVLGHSHKVGEISYGISGNFSYARTKSQYVEESDKGNAYLNWTGKTAYRWNDIVWGYNCIGQFQSLDEIYNSPVEDSDGNRKLLPGDLKYEDVNKDGIISSDDTKPILRNNTPQVNYGITLNFAWKGFDINALFQGATRFNIYLSEQFKAPIPWGRNGLAQYYDRWHRTDLFDQNSAWVPGKYPSTRVNGTDAWNHYTSTFTALDGSYLRLKNLEVGYTLPKKIITKIGIEKCRIYANGFNLKTWTDNDYVDPEHTMDTYGYLYPITKNINVGLSVTF
jgi:TonB-linked SusC/RagA family outer membrane protein